MTKLTLEQHEFDVLRGIIDDRLNSLKKNIAMHSDNLDEYESDIKNYTTYDLYVKLMEVEKEQESNNIMVLNYNSVHDNIRRKYDH